MGRASDAGRRTTHTRAQPRSSHPSASPSAGDVPYDTRGFVEKNADKLSRNLYALLAGAAEGRTRALFPPKSDAEAGKKASTVAEKFRGQLTKLMTTVERTRPFFIRCIKPNQQKLPAGTAGSLQMKMTIEQLTYAGVFEAVKIRKMGYPFRLEHHEFAATYRWIARKANGWAPIQAHPQAAPAQYVAAVLASVHQDFSKVHIGRTLCLYRADDHRTDEVLPPLPACHHLPSLQVPRRRAPRPRAAEEPRARADLPADAGVVPPEDGPSRDPISHTPHPPHLQASFRRKMGRVYRQLLRQALHSLGAALAHVKAAPEIGPQEVQQMEYAMQAYHDHLGRFGAIFGEYQPADLVEVQRLHQVSRERSSREIEPRMIELKRAAERHVTPSPMSPTPRISRHR